MILNPSLASRIMEEGTTAYPDECCGAILGEFLDGESGVIHKASALYPIDNARESDERYHRFAITPEDYMRAEREAMRIGADVVGFYHSHPDAPAVPSEYDREHALPNYSYLIVSVEGDAAPRAAELSGWLLSLDRSRFDRDEIRITG